MFPGDTALCVRPVDPLGQESSHNPVMEPSSGLGQVVKGRTPLRPPLADYRGMSDWQKTQRQLKNMMKEL